MLFLSLYLVRVNGSNIQNVLKSSRICIFKRFSIILIEHSFMLISSLLIWSNLLGFHHILECPPKSWFHLMHFLFENSVYVSKHLLIRWSHIMYFRKLRIATRWCLIHWSYCLTYKVALFKLWVNRTHRLEPSNYIEIIINHIKEQYNDINHTLKA